MDLFVTSPEMNLIWKIFDMDPQGSPFATAISPRREFWSSTLYLSNSLNSFVHWSLTVVQKFSKSWRRYYSDLTDDNWRDFEKRIFVLIGLLSAYMWIFQLYLTLIQSLNVKLIPNWNFQSSINRFWQRLKWLFFRNSLKISKAELRFFHKRWNQRHGRFHGFHPFLNHSFYHTICLQSRREILPEISLNWWWTWLTELVVLKMNILVYLLKMHFAVRWIDVISELSMRKLRNCPPHQMCANQDPTLATKCHPFLDACVMKA